jgi:hypothetical protein
MFVRCDNDPDVQAARIPGLTWCAVKTNGPDASLPEVRAAWVARMRRRGVTVGSWVFCGGPPMDDAIGALDSWQPSLTVYDVESPYKTDENPVAAGWPRNLVLQHASRNPAPAAVTSYGAIPGYGNQPSSIDFGAFCAAGWPIFAQGYDSFTCSDALTYLSVYPSEGIHCLTRSLRLDPGQAVYRPESLDG